MIFLVSLPSAYGERFEVIIPSGASQPDFPNHFKPQEITVRPGDTVRWLNGDTDFHTVTSGSLETGPDGKFDSGYLNPGKSFDVRFDVLEIGEKKYFCTLHPWLTGIVNVIAVEKGFQVFHNVGQGITEKTFDMQYKLQRNLVSIDIDPVLETITFTVSGTIDDDSLTVKLPEELIKNPSTVWLDQKQITDFTQEKQDQFNVLTIPLVADTEIIKIRGTDVIGKIPPKQTLVINQIIGVADKKFYDRDESITISGEIKNPSQVNSVLVEIISPTGVTVYSQNAPLFDYKFTRTVNPLGILRDFGEYDVKITAAGSKTLYLSFEYGFAPRDVATPKHQMKQDVLAEDVICFHELVLVIKQSNNAAACVTENTASKLIERGWAISVDDYVKSK